MSVLRYNIVSDKKPYKPREEHLRTFFANIKKGNQPVNSVSDTLITDKATSDIGRIEQKKGLKRKVSSTSRPKKKTKKVDAIEKKIKKHKFK